MSKISSPELTVLVVGEPRELWEWGEAGGKRTRTVRRRDVTGVDISAVEVVVASPVVGVQQGVAEVPDASVPLLSAMGKFAVLVGRQQAVEFSTRKDSYDVSVVVSGVESATVTGDFVHQGVKAAAK